MKRVLAIAVMSVLAFFGFAGTASASDELTPQEEQCFDEFFEAFDDLTAHLDDVEFEQLVYDINDLLTKFDMGQLTLEELEAELNALLPGVFDLLVELEECLGVEGPTMPDVPRKPAAVPTSVPAGALPDTGAGIAPALVGLGLAAAGGAVLLARRRLTNNS
jgi:LPXTG-motif cell wall-anchored protein